MRRYEKWTCCLVVAFAISLCSAVAKHNSEDEIVAMDLLIVKQPGSPAESRLRVIRLTTRSGATGYGDYFEYGLPAKNEEATLVRLVNRYAEQKYKKNHFLTDPSMRAVGGGHTVFGKTAAQILNADPVEDLRLWAFFPREGFGPMWQGPEIRTGDCLAGCLARPRRAKGAVPGAPLSVDFDRGGSPGQATFADS